MKRLTFFMLMNVLAANAALAQETWITNASLVDPAKQTIRQSMTVVLKDGLITAVHKKKAPPQATTIDAAGKYLMPGLTDAHVHFFQSGGLYTRPDIIDLRKIRPYADEIKAVHAGFEQQLRRYVQNGITTVFDVGTTRRFLTRRQAIEGWAAAPQVYMAGPIITTGLIHRYDSLQDDTPFILATDAAAGRRLVQEQLPWQPDLIKLLISSDSEAPKNYLPIVEAVIDEAHHHGLRVAVHATTLETARQAAEADADYLVHNVESETIDDAFVALLKKKKIVVCPALSVKNGYLHTFDQSRVFTTRELNYAEPFALGSVYDMKQLPDTAIARLYKMKADERQERTAAAVRLNQQNLKKLSDAGVHIVSGSDAGNIGTLHAVSLLPELLLMQQSGMSNWQVIQAATINAAGILDRPGYTGNITAGQPANMLLLEGDPTTDLGQLEHIRLVIRKGQVISPDTLVHHSTESLVQQQLNAYNTRNMEAFLEPYAEDVELFAFPDKLVCRGKEQMRKVYHFFNLASLLHCRIEKRIIEGNFVIDEEHILDDHGRKRGTAVYHIQNGKIRKVFFIN
ncbi:amidohydrolase family protein [Chitinophaga eiseniae]|nr:amidohydrolase family protein [Chitinophaga eiseniae]